MKKDNLKDICFLPLDVPLINSKLNIIRSFKQKQLENYIWWNRDILYGKSEQGKPFGDEETQWTDSALEDYPEIVTLVKTFLPFKQLLYIHLAQAKEEILPHVDENYVEKPFPFHRSILPDLKKHLELNEPIGYRFLIQGHRNSLYLCKDYDPSYKNRIVQNKIHCQLPIETDFFLIRNGEIPHGVEFDPNEDRLVGFILGSVHPHKHQKLIKKSLQKFRSSCLYKHDLEELE